METNMETIEANLNGGAEPDAPRFASFREFYPYYMAEHSNRTCRRLHFIGSSISLVAGTISVLTLNPLFMIGGVLTAYGFAWYAHFAFEKNKPAAWKYFRYSFIGDWVMFSQILTGKIPF
jgi:hypothetical protein